MGTIVAIYIIWIIILVLIACCGCKRVSLSGRFVMGVTMSAILFVIAGYIASGYFDATRQTALVFMLQYGVSEDRPADASRLQPTPEVFLSSSSLPPQARHVR